MVEVVSNRNNFLTFVNYELDEDHGEFQYGLVTFFLWKMEEHNTSRLVLAKPIVPNT